MTNHTCHVVLGLIVGAVPVLSLAELALSNTWVPLRSCDYGICGAHGAAFVAGLSQDVVGRFGPLTRGE